MEASELGNLVDLFGAQRDERLAADKVAAKLKERENELKEQIIAALREAENKGITGRAYGVKLSEKDKPVAADWAAIHKYILENDALDLLHRRLTEEAVKVRWADGLVIPGVEHFTVYDLTVSRSK